MERVSHNFVISKKFQTIGKNLLKVCCQHFSLWIEVFSCLTRWQIEYPVPITLK